MLKFPTVLFSTRTVRETEAQASYHDISADSVFTTITEKPPHVVNCIRLMANPYSVRVHSDEHTLDQKFEQLSEQEFVKICGVLHGIQREVQPRILVLEDETFIVNNRTWVEFNR